MARIVEKPTVRLDATLTIDEEELRALHAMTVYGVPKLLKFFYQYMGESALQPHEAGFLRLFEHVKDKAPAIIRRYEQAKDAFG